MKKSVPNTKTKLETRSVEDFNTAWEEHKVRVRSLMKQGFFGFAGGALFVLCVWTMIISFSDETSTDGFPMILVFAALGGIGCLGLPFGWGIMNRLTGHWSIWVHIYIVIALFVFKVGLALVIGLWGYPVALVYHLIQSQKSKRRIKRTWITLAVIYAVCVVIVGISAVITQSTNGSAHNDSDIQPSVIETGALRVVTATSIEEESDIPAKLSEVALEGTQVYENERVTE